MTKIIFSIWAMGVALSSVAGFAEPVGNFDLNTVLPNGKDIPAKPNRISQSTQTDPVVDQSTQTDEAPEVEVTRYGQIHYMFAGAVGGFLVAGNVATAFLQDGSEYSDLAQARQLVGQLCGLELAPEMAYFLILPILGSAAGAGVGGLVYPLQANILAVAKAIHDQLPNRPNFGSWLPNPTLHFFYGMFSVSAWPKK